MKKIIFILVLVVSAFAEAAQTENMPDVLYMVGNMNGWTTPIDGGTQYPLYDEDHDGIYTGEFDIPVQEDDLQFKIFIKNDGWNYGSFLSTNASRQNLFSDQPRKIALTLQMTSNIIISNWKGGKLQIEVSCDDNDQWNLILKGPDQPAQPEWLKEIYLVGEFNDWQLPSADNLNGAYTIPLDINYYYAGRFEIPAGEASFYIVTLDRETGAPIKWGHSAPFPPFQIYQMEGNSSFHGDVTMTAYSQAYYNVVPFTIADFRGGEIQIVAFLTNGEDLSFQVRIESFNAPWFDIPNPIYGVYDTGGGQSDVISLPVDKGNDYMNHVWSVGPDVQIFFSSEESLEYNPSSCWGMAEDDELDLDRQSMFYRLVKGGKPFRANFGAVPGQTGEMIVVGNWQLGVAEVIINKNSGVDEIGVDGSATEPVYFNLQGVRVENPTSGLYIKVSGPKSEKIVIR